MKKLLIYLLLSISLFQANYSKDIPEIYCKHFFYGYPLGTPSSNDLIIRDLYALSSNDSTKFADWVAYRLERKYLEGRAPDRVWKADPWLDDNETLEPNDYNDASKIYNYDRGHMAPLASFKGSDEAAETNYLSNITPQNSNLNRGPWKILEDMERKLLDSFEMIYVMTGPFYEKQMPKLPKADEPHVVPSGYWKIIIIPITQRKFEAVAFIFTQDVDYSDKVIDHVVSIDEIEKRSKLDFLWQLDDKIEEQVEKEPNRKIANKFFK
jgi:endonuclease G